MRMSCGVAAGRVAQDVAAAARRRRAPSPRSPAVSGSFWRVRASATGPSDALDRQRPGRGGLVGVAGSHEPQVGDGAQGRVMLDGLVGRAVLAEPDRVVGPDVDDVDAGQRRQADRPAHVVAEGQERRARTG